MRTVDSGQKGKAKGIKKGAEAQTEGKGGVTDIRACVDGNIFAKIIVTVTAQ